MRPLAFVSVLVLSAAPARAADGPKVVSAWAAGPLELRVVFDRDLPAGLAEALVGTRIVFGDDVKAGDRFVSRDPDSPPPGGPEAPARGSLRIAAARAEGRFLTLATDPHSRDTTYALHLPAPVDRDVTYRLRGVEYAWEQNPPGSKPLASGVWTGLDGDDLAVKRTAGLTRLTLRTLLAAPKGKVTVTARSSVPGSVDLGGESVKSTPNPKGGFRAEATAEAETDVLDLTLTFDLDAAAPLALATTYRTAADPTDRPIPTDRLVLPWAPPPAPAASTLPVPEGLLKGGDPVKGAVVFRSEAAKCATCHKVRGEGGEVGPDLSGSFHRDRAWVFRQINEPSAPIHPDYVPYVVQTKDGRVLAGIVRAEGVDAIKVTDAEAKSTVVKKAEIEELKPSATSIMPVGLLGQVGEEGVRDLLAFLTSPPPK